MADSIKQKAAKAAAMYLKASGYEIIYEGGDPCDIIASHNGELVLIRVIYRNGEKGGGYPTEDLSEEKRRGFERKMIKYVRENNVNDSTLLRFDYLGIILLGGRALVKHHVNAFGGYCG